MKRVTKRGGFGCCYNRVVGMHMWRYIIGVHRTATVLAIRLTCRKAVTERCYFSCFGVRNISCAGSCFFTGFGTSRCFGLRPLTIVMPERCHRFGVGISARAGKCFYPCLCTGGRSGDGRYVIVCMRRNIIGVHRTATVLAIRLACRKLVPERCKCFICLITANRAGVGFGAGIIAIRCFGNNAFPKNVFMLNIIKNDVCFC